MDKKGRLSRLGAKLVGMSVLGLVLAFTAFYLVDNLAVPWLLYSERFAPLWEARQTAVIQSWQDYITGNGLTVDEAAEYVEQFSRNSFSSMVTTYLTTADSARADMSVSTIRLIAPNVYQSLTSFVELYPIQCADGVLSITTPSVALQIRNFVRLAGLLLSLLIFCAVMIPGIVRLVRRIGVLSRETGVLMAGDLDHAIKVKGRDELSALGEDIERLRLSVLARLEGEREAVGANARLITSLSHDIRTPLTKLTGYLDILSYEKYRSQAERDEFLRLASEKAAQLKALTDQLFASAQVAAPASGLERPPEAVDGAALLGQLLTEQGGDLRREGFDMEPPVFRRAFTLYLRTEDAVRVFDNLFSNLRKYADPAFPIRMGAEDRADSVVLRIENRALPAPDRADSHGLGVPTMRELMERSGGTLEASLEDGIYKSVLTFPKHREAR